MLRVAMLALGATLTIGALAPQDAAAQSGRQRAQGRGDVTVDGRRTSDRVYSDGRCSEYDRVDRRRHDDDDDRWEKGRGKHKDKRDRDDDRYENGRYNGSYDPDCNYSNERGGKGPKFCQNGQGHPVHGMAWCREKGFGLQNTGWQDVILRRPRYDTRSDLGRSVLQDVLGRVVYGRFDSQRSRLGVRQPLIGRWQDTAGGTLLNLFAGGVQIAQILDRNRDGRADLVLMNYGNR